MRRWIGIAVVCVSVLAAPVLVFAQALADKVPQDAMIYFGWKGADNLGPAYEQSHLKAVLDASNLPEYFRDVVPKLLAKATEGAPEAGAAVETRLTIGSSLWRHPCALYVGPVEVGPAGAPPVIHAALLCDAGNDAAVLANQWQKILDKIGPAPIPLAVEQHGTLVAFVVGQGLHG